MSQSEFKKRLKVLMNKPENQVCSDCPERQPRWASLIVPPPGSAPGSLAIGAFTCLECSGSHRRLGVHIAFVRSVTLDSWKEKEVKAMENGGNQKVNAIFEANLSVSKPTTSASGSVRERFIRDKYERRKYFSAAALQSYQESDDESSESESEDEQPVRPTVRAPSEAAKMRAQARKQRLGKVSVSAPPGSTKASSSTKKQSSSAVQKRQPAKAPAPAPYVADLLDFGLPVTNDPGPPPNPPSASPSPTLDMFKNMSVSDGNGNGMMASNVNNVNNNINSNQGGGHSPPKQNVALNNNMNNDRSKKIDDIMGLFNTPTNNNFNAFGGMNMNNNMNNNANNGMMMQNQMGSQNTNMNGMMNNQMMQNSGSNQMMNNSTMMNSFNNNMNNMTQSMPQNNMNFFNGMQNMNNNMHGNSGQSQFNQEQSKNSGMQMQQNQTDFGMAPMGGTPSNLNVLGGQSMGSHQQQSFGGESKDNSGFGFMGGSSTANNGGENPQMNQFASFGSFR